ncbi:MAG: thiamine diphosphate-binding protein [Monoraphidium minutum]|nr:MAG: thiamine diphosphate-binding protein [Monoraphidium minutum]
MDSRWLTAAEYLGMRLKELGVTHLFVVPGDYNLPLLDGLAAVPGLTLVNTANELNAAYAADGHARSQGLGCVVTTFLVGALSAINGTAASYAEEVPVLSVVGVPGTSQYATSSAPHHSLGNLEDISQEVDCYKPVTVYQSILRSLKDARYIIDKALLKALNHRKPVLLEVCRDVALLPHPSFGRRGAKLEPFARPVRPCNEDSLRAAAAAAAEWLADKQRPLIVVGRRARHYKEQLLEFAEASGYGVVAVADGKSFFPEDHPQFIGTYFKSFSDPASISETVAASDALIFAGVCFHEFNWPSVPDNATHERGLILYKARAVLALTRAFTMVPTSRMLPALAARVARNPGALAYFAGRPAVPPALPHSGPDFTAPDDAPLKTEQVYDEIKALLRTPGYDMIMDTGDGLWRATSMKLAKGNSYECQWLAGNIGPALPAGLGFSLGAATRTGNRCVVVIGDGGLQMTAQEIGTYARFGSTAIVVVVNNDGYLIERTLSPIVHASYNYVNRWDYTAVASAMCNGHGRYKVMRATSLDEARAAFAAAVELTDHFVFIEAVVSKTDAAPAAGMVRRQFQGAFFSSFPLYKERLQAEFGPDFVRATAGIAAKRAMSESISDALAAAALSPRTSLEGRGPLGLPVDIPNGGGDTGRGSRAAGGSAFDNGPSMPTIDSIGSMVSLVGSGDASSSGLAASPHNPSTLGL